MITLDRVTFDYPVFQSGLLRPLRGVKESDTDQSVGGRIIRNGRNVSVRALDNIVTTFEPGTCTGLIGSNGAGKSTLLRVLAGILPISLGKISIQGSVSTLFTRNVGSDRYATGIDNIRLIASLYGINKGALKDLIDDVADFTELGDYMYLPMHTYSAGMSARLGFAIASHMTSEILLIDEVIGAGDSTFQKKAKARLFRIIENSGTVVLASHNRQLLSQFCEEIIWLRSGRLEQRGPTVEVYREFAKMTRINSGSD